MRQYLEMIEHVLTNGEKRENRTGVDTIGVFGYQNRYDLSKGFPATTTKKLAFKSVVSELLWFLCGDTDERTLAEIHYGKHRSELDGKRTIWSDNAIDYVNRTYSKKYLEVIGTQYLDCGEIYGEQMRNFGEQSDQITNLINGLMTDPMSRRHIINLWNPVAVDTNNLALPPCHTLSQFYVDGNNRLSCQMYQRSADLGLGVPFNIASYSLLTHIIAREVGFEVGEFIHTFGDLHIYENHIDALKLQLTRDPATRPTPQLRIANDFVLMNEKGAVRYDFNHSDVMKFTLENYEPYDTIKMEMAV